MGLYTVVILHYKKNEIVKGGIYRNDGLLLSSNIREHKYRRFRKDLIMLLSEIRLYYAVNHIDISFISFSFSSLSYETAVILEHRPEDFFSLLAK